MAEQDAEYRAKYKQLLNNSQVLVRFTITTVSTFPRSARQSLSDRMVNLSIDVLTLVIDIATNPSLEIDEDMLKKIKSPLLSLNALFIVCYDLQYVPAKVFGEFGRIYNLIKDLLSRLTARV